jgi:hypothetical protein
LEQMDMHDIANVRGGTYSAVTLSPMHLACLREQIQHANGICFRCDQPGHIAKTCPQQQQQQQQQAIVCHGCKQPGHVVRECKQTVCFKCGQNGHWARDCR